MPLISVIMSTYIKDNFEYLKLAIQSILVQSYREIELVIVADGDISLNAKNYITDLQNNDKRLRFFQLEKNGGPAKARNFGINQSKGDYIAILDSDDVAHVDRLKKQIEYLTENKIDLIGSNYQEMTEQGIVLGEKKLPELHKNIFAQMPFHCAIANPTVFARKEVFEAYKYEESIRLGEDYRLWIRLLAAGFKFGNIQENLIDFRKADNFFQKRRGLSYAKSDFATKWMARKLLRPSKWPLLFAMAVLSFVVRMLPPLLFRFAHQLKNRLG